MANRAQRRATERTKLPPRRVQCDDYVVVIDGQEYRPHAGEYVCFGSGSSVADYLPLMDLVELKDSLDEANVGRFREALTALIQGLDGSIIEWSWTDNDGGPYENPPDQQTIGGLEIGELMYLYQAKAGQVGAGGEARNGASPPPSSWTRR